MSGRLSPHLLANRLGRNTWLRVAVRTVQLPVREVVDIVLRLLPRRRDLYVFGAPLARFSDNAAYLFVSLSREQSEVECVWITPSREIRDRLRGEGYRSHLKWSLAGVWSCARAAAFVYNAYVSDVNRWLWRGAVTVNLWHGVPFKRIERDILDGPMTLIYSPVRLRGLIERVFRDERHTPSLLLSPSDEITRRCFASAFAIAPSDCVVAGYPRNEHFGRGRPGLVDLLPSGASWDELAAAPLVVGYFPTWRDNHAKFLDGPGQLAVNDLANVVVAAGGRFVFKSHYNSSFADVERMPGVTQLHREDDLHAFLPLCDILITDYSSVAFDFMSLDRPIVYFAPDLDEFLATRGAYFEPDEVMPGPIVSTAAELLALFAHPEKLAVSDRLSEVRESVWGVAVARSSERIAAAVAARVNGGAGVADSPQLEQPAASTTAA